MKEYFKEQMSHAHNVPISKYDLKVLKGKSIYGEYKKGDKILHFLEYRNIEEESLIDGKIFKTNGSFHMTAITDRDFDQLEKDYNYIRTANSFPILERKL